MRLQRCLPGKEQEERNCKEEHGAHEEAEGGAQWAPLLFPPPPAEEERRQTEHQHGDERRGPPIDVLGREAALVGRGAGRGEDE